ncbi:MAG: hypothetical protein AAFQ40_14690 [Cyanobacteria bacterium J06623_5]
MSESDEFRKYLVADEPLPPKLFTEEPTPLPPPVEKAPSGLAPMSRIELEGRAYRGIAGGNIPWWVLISGAAVLLLPVLALMLVMAYAGWLLFSLPLLAVPGMIIWRGVSAKLAAQKARAVRQARRRRDMRD